MPKIVHAQTVLMEDELEALKKKTDERTTKDALATAVYHYLECTNVHEDMWAKKLETIVQKKLKTTKNN